MHKLLVLLITSTLVISCSKTANISEEAYEEDNTCLYEIEKIIEKTEYIHVEDYNGGIFEDDGIDNTLEIVFTIKRLKWMEWDKLYF